MAIVSRPQGVRWRNGALLLVALATGCAQLGAPPYAADYEALDRLEAHNPGKVAVAKVQPTDPNDRINTLGLRRARLVSPSGTFAQYLEDALMRDLGVINGSGRMDVEVTVTRNAAQTLRKTYRGEIAFDSSYANIVAVPAGQAAYPRLVRALLRQVYADPQFVAAIAPSAQ